MRWLRNLLLLARGGLAFRHRRRRLEKWLDTAVSCGLKVLDCSNQTALQLKVEARAGPITVRIEEPQKASIRLVADIPGPQGFSSVRVCYRAYGQPRADLREVGDELFDRAFYVEGPMGLASVLLDAEMRRWLMRMNNPRNRLEISRGQLLLETFDKDLSEILPFFLDISRRLDRPVNIAQGLAENARQDPEAGVRLRNLLVLVRGLPSDPFTLEVLRNACSDPSPEVRLRAARELGAEGRGVLEELAEGLADDAVSAQAIAFLGRELPYERMIAILDQALRRYLVQTARACLKALGRCGPAAVDTLAEVMAREYGELSAAAAAALGETGSPAAEPSLILALQREQADLRVAAAIALARVGSTLAVLPLKEAAERYSSDPDLRRATRQAIAQIQSRLHGASPGQLSLAGTEAGQLSLAQAETGQLSLSDTGGQLSFPSAEPGQLSLGGDAAD